MKIQRQVWRENYKGNEECIKNAGRRQHKSDDKQMVSIKVDDCDYNRVITIT